MSCQQAEQIDCSAYLAEPRGPQWGAFRAHFPTCQDCSRAVARWTRLETAITGVAEATGSGEHPAEELLLHFEDEPARLGTEQRHGIEVHLASCALCSDTLAALRTFDFNPSREAAAAIGAGTPALIERLGGWLSELLAVPVPQPVLAVGLVSLLALPVGLYLVSSTPGEHSDPQVAQHPVVDPKPESVPRPVTPPEHEPLLAHEAPPPALDEQPLAEPVSPAIPAREEEELLAQRTPKPAPDPGAPTRVEAIPEPTPEAPPLIVAALDPALLPRAFPSYASPWGGTGPQGRIGSSLRSAGGASEAQSLMPLAPAEVGQTIDPQPTLYYFVPERTLQPIEITISSRFEIDPLLEQRIEPPLEAGIHALSLADHGVELTPGTAVDWSLTLVREEGRPTANPTTRARLELVAEEPELVAALEATPSEHAANIYAAHGLWYDAIDALSTFIEQHPDVATLHERRAALMDAQGLEDAAAFDRQTYQP